MLSAKNTSAALYLTCILLANAFVILWGVGVLSLSNLKTEQVYFAITFPLGTMWIGIAFSFRDFVQRYWGNKWIWFWMFLATIITWFFNQSLAYASLTAFIVAASINWIMFYFLQHKTLKFRVVVTNIVVCPIDSILFVTIPFGVPWYSEIVWGQALVKYGCGLLALPLVSMFERWHFRTEADKNNKP